MENHVSNSMPNVLLITADQLRYDCVGISGRYPVQTPNLDKLAREGAFFTQAYSHIPLCCPARQSLLNGRRPETFGALWNFSGALPVGALPPDSYTWPKQLGELGYTSAFLGKWGVHPDHDATTYGYDVYVGEMAYAQFQQQHYSQVRFTNGFFGEANPIPVHDAKTHWFAERAIEAMERLQQVGRPWHLALHLSDPHLPCRPSGRFADMYDPSQVPEWDGFRDSFAGKPYIQRQQLYNWGVQDYTWEDWAPIVARYYGMISQLDDAIGKVLQALEETGGAENTLVIFTADHGDMCGSHRMMDKHYILYDDVVHVPLMYRWPGRIEPDVKHDRFVYNILDLPPTVLEAAGAGQPRFLQGRSLLPLLLNEAEDLAKHVGWREDVVTTYNGQQFGLYTQRMIRTRDWKYIWNTTDVDELYDLGEDPGELNNRIADPAHVDVVSDLRRRLYDRLASDGDALVANEWTKRQLLNGQKL